MAQRCWDTGGACRRLEYIILPLLRGYFRVAPRHIACVSVVATSPFRRVLLSVARFAYAVRATGCLRRGV